MPQQRGVNQQQAVALVRVTGNNRVDDTLVIGPDFTQILQVGEHAQSYRLVGFPVGLQQSLHENVVQVLVDGEVEQAVFGVGDLDRPPVELGPGRGNQSAQLGMVL